MNNEFMEVLKIIADKRMEEMHKARVDGLVSLMNEKNVTFEELKP